MSSPSPSSGPELLALLNTMEVYNQTHGMIGINEDYLAVLAKVIVFLTLFSVLIVFRNFYESS